MTKRFIRQHRSRPTLTFKQVSGLSFLPVYKSQTGAQNREPVRTFRFLVGCLSMAGHKSKGTVSFKPFIPKWHCSPEGRSGCISVLRSPGGSHGGGGRPGRQSEGPPKWVGEQKVTTLGAVSPRRQANLHPRRGRPNPAFPNPLHTFLGLRGLNTDSKVQRREGSGDRTRRLPKEDSRPPHRMGLWGSRFRTGREAGPGAEGSVTHRGAARAAAPSLAPWAGAGKGKRTGDPKGRGAAGRPAPGTPAALNPGPPPPPPPLTRGAPPLLAPLRGEGGAEVGIGGRAPAQRTGPAIHWLRRSWPESAIGCAGLSGSPWARRAGKMSSSEGTAQCIFEPCAPC